MQCLIIPDGTCRRLVASGLLTAREYEAAKIKPQPIPHTMRMVVGYFNVFTVQKMLPTK